MNILVVSENFSKGGLETHISTYYNLIKDKHNVYFAFANYEDNNYLINAKIYTDFHFSYNSSIKDFCSDVSKLVSIIKKHNIDVIHVHPFYSIFPAIFAANLTNTKLVYTYHGYGSINFVSSSIDSILFSYAVDQRINKIFCVSDNVIEYFNELHSKNIIYLPNIINEKLYPKHDISNNKTWALISRIDIDKYSSIIKFLEMLPKLDIKYVDIYGTGLMFDELKKYIEKNKLINKVKLKGFVSQINEVLNNYVGTIGIGRVTMESLCMNYPSILVGYNKVIGVIDDEIYEKVKTINFVPAALEDITIEKFNQQLKSINAGNNKKFQHRDKIIKDFGKINIEKYINELKMTTFYSTDIFNEIYNLIFNIKNNEKFYTSRMVYNIISSKLATQTRNFYFKAMINNFNKYYELLDNQNKIENKIDNMISNLNNKNNDLKNELNEYKRGKLYKFAKKLYILKSKIIRKEK